MKQEWILISHCSFLNINSESSCLYFLLIFPFKIVSTLLNLQSHKSNPLCFLLSWVTRRQWQVWVIFSRNLSWMCCQSTNDLRLPQCRCKAESLTPPSFGGFWFLGPVLLSSVFFPFLFLVLYSWPFCQRGCKSKLMSHFFLCSFFKSSFVLQDLWIADYFYYSK